MIANRDQGNRFALEEGVFDKEEAMFLDSSVTFLVGVEVSSFVEHGSWFAADDEGNMWSLHAATGVQCVVAEEL